MKMLTAFPLYRGDKRRHECSICYKARHKAYYAKDPDAYKQRTRSQYERNGRRYYNSLREDVVAMLGGRCACCGETEPKFLAIDHVENDGNVDRRKIGSGYGALRKIRDAILTGEGQKYQVLCHNCNMGKKVNGGICPHKEGSSTIPSGSRAKRPEARGTLRGDDIVSSCGKP